MKDLKSGSISVRIVGHRREWNKHFRFTAKQWRFGLIVAGGVVPLLLTFAVYGLLTTFLGGTRHPQRFARASDAVRGEVVALSRNTAAGLAAMGLELGALNADATQLTDFQRRLARSAGLRSAAFGAPARPTLVPVRQRGGHLTARLHALARRLSSSDLVRKGRTL